MAKTTDRQLTEMCRTIFGNIVKKAYFFYDEYSKDACDRFVSLTNDNSLNWSGESFTIEFTNGSIVHFKNSEWAFLKRLDTQNKV